MQRQGKGRGEEEGHRDHMGWVIVEMQIGIPNVGYPIEVAKDAVGEAMSSCAKQQGAHNNQCHISQNREAKGKWNMIAHAKLSADFNFS